jgi:hypothetical protein
VTEKKKTGTARFTTEPETLVLVRPHWEKLYLPNKERQNPEYWAGGASTA